MANYPQGLAQVAVCQSHTGHMTGLWFLSTRPLRLDTNDEITNADDEPNISAGTRKQIIMHLIHVLLISP
jgi:hypothetical protein